MNQNPKHAPDRDRGPANDNAPAAAGGAANDNEKAIASAAAGAAGGALTSLAALSAALNKVDIAALAGRSGLPLMQFKSRENNGTWGYGPKKIEPEYGRRWALNPSTYMQGYVGFGEGGKVHERLVPISQPKPEIADLPDLGFKWQEQMGVNMKCLDGADAGVEVTFKTATTGGVQAVAASIAAVRDHLNGGQHDGKVVPIVLLEKDSYPHPEYGRIWYPLLTIVDWMALPGPAPAPTGTPPAAPPPAEQPRRRRVA